jgi:hypothetical protein
MLQILAQLWDEILFRRKAIFQGHLKSLGRLSASERFQILYLDHLKSPKRATTSHQQTALRAAFLESKGRLLEWAHDLQKKTSPHLPSPFHSTLFPNLTESHVEKSVADLNSQGFHVLPFRLPREWIHSVNQALSSMDAISRSDERDVQKPSNLKPRTATYWHTNPEELLAVPELKALVLDSAVREIAGRYLACSPVLDMLVAWWSYPTPGPDAASAQMYHFDLDRIRWIKVFVYLTDVTVDNGPHAFIPCSHRNVGERVVRDSRYSDEEVSEWYPEVAPQLFIAPAGTVFLEDTLGLHKGIPVKSGIRGVFECEYSINHFGFPHPRLPFE